MKVYIGPYKNWFGPYQIADLVFFWLEKYPSDELAQRWDYKLHDKFGPWLAGGEDRESWLMKLCLWIEKKRNRTIKVRIDPYDTWSMDHTLALIVLPMLKQLQATKHGSPHVDDEDVPEHLRSTSAPPKENEWDTDGLHHQRWDWVLDEMIQAFECLVNEGWDQQYWSGEWGKTTFVPTNEKIFNPITNREEETYTMEHSGNRECDWDALHAHQKRNDNGYRLFGKYFRALWD